jgi:thymidine phosphorylase
MSKVFLPQEVIRRKRDGEELSVDEIGSIVAGITDNTVSEGQAAAFAMATFFSGMTATEKVTLTQAMANSGDVLEWSSLNLPGPIVDKHSSGGVGDKVSLILAPIMAACGGYVPMISGRGLGHTGGTLDKLDSIQGYRTNPDLATFRNVVRDVGCAIIGQTDDLAPADRRLYGIRDVTATVESIPLITASILSKKLAAGLDAMVMDVKTGSGAFADNMTMARDLAHSIVDVANGAGMKTSAMITDMNQVLGYSAGNALEVRECVALMKGEAGDERLREVTIELCAELCLISGLQADPAESRRKVVEVLENGQALEIFSRMVHALGGAADFVYNMDRDLTSSAIKTDILAPRAGYVSRMDTRAIGIAIVELGGGRQRASDGIDHSVGLDRIAQIGDKVELGQPLAVLHASSEEFAPLAVHSVQSAIELSDEKPQIRKIVLERIPAKVPS